MWHKLQHGALLTLALAGLGITIYYGVWLGFAFLDQFSYEQLTLIGSAGLALVWSAYATWLSRLIWRRIQFYRCRGRARMAQRFIAYGYEFTSAEAMHAFTAPLAHSGGHVTVSSPQDAMANLEHAMQDTYGAELTDGTPGAVAARAIGLELLDVYL